jgi:hypothetical protein
LSANRETDDRLRQLVAKSGIAPDRLIFAEKKPNPQHLARYVLADLFLDTFPYGAHTTASDVMWMGTPVLTYPGNSFASRVCASLVHAAGIGDFVCDGPENFVARAIEIGKDPAKTAAIKARLKSTRSSSTLFDTSLLVRELEGLYRAMWADTAKGSLPSPDLANLDEYFDIGLDIALGDGPPSALNELRAVYLDKLRQRDEAHPIELDSRLWTERETKALR